MRCYHHLVRLQSAPVRVQMTDWIVERWTLAGKTVRRHWRWQHWLQIAHREWSSRPEQRKVARWLHQHERSHNSDKHRRHKLDSGQVMVTAINSNSCNRTKKEAPTRASWLSHRVTVAGLNQYGLLSKCFIWRQVASGKETKMGCEDCLEVHTRDKLSLCAVEKQRKIRA